MFLIIHSICKVMQKNVQCQQVINCCQQHPTLMKVIVETGAFSNSTDIEKSAQGIIDTGADMLKTSTEKIKPFSGSGFL